MLSAPFAPSFTLVDPAATAAPLEVTNAGHVNINVPEAGVPSARYTVSETVVEATPPCGGTGTPNAESPKPATKISAQ
jgi:hypothetical protein